ncbi:MAG: hypothetical protein VYA55_22040 [Pseudomonadota bacterium]|nr:hypothetical protein [Pseudomonadota bacterium]
MSKKSIVVILSLAVALIVLAFGYLAKQKYDQLLKSTSEGLALGKAHGKMIHQADCLLGLKMKYAKCSTTDCELSANGYIAGCMQAAKKDDFCSSVPNIKDTKKAISWVSSACSDQNPDGDKCLKYMHKFVSVCTEQNESRKISKGELFKAGFDKGLDSSQN